MSEAANARLCEQHLHFHLIATRNMMYVRTLFCKILVFADDCM